MQTTDELMRAYDAADKTNLAAFPSLQGLSRDQVEAALRNYDRRLAQSQAK